MEDLINNTAKPKGLIMCLADFVLTLITAVLLLVLCITLCFDLCKVEGTSMTYTIKDESYVLCVAPNNLHKGDIVIATVNDNGFKKNIIKRIVAQPNDKILFAFDETKNVKQYLCGDDGNYHRCDENYIRDEKMTTECFVGAKGEHMFTQEIFNLYECEAFSEIIESEKVDEKYIISLSEDEYFLLGDNRENSRDSRHYGKFKKEDLQSKMFLEIDGGPLYYIVNALYFISNLRNISSISI